MLSLPPAVAPAKPPGVSRGPRPGRVKISGLLAALRAAPARAGRPPVTLPPPPTAAAASNRAYPPTTNHGRRGRRRAPLERLGRARARTEEEGYQLREIWHKTTELHAENEKARSELEGKARQNFVAPDTRINLNVGGQIFETTAGILCKDRWSVLAALCDRDEPIIAPDDDGTFFLDRDWWIFRHILNWLRTDALPQDPMVLLEMYNEAMFYGVEGCCAGRAGALQGRATAASSGSRGTKFWFAVVTARMYKTVAQRDGANPRCYRALPGNRQSRNGPGRRRVR